jgi:hypothetical protein
MQTYNSKSSLVDRMRAKVVVATLGVLMTLSTLFAQNAVSIQAAPGQATVLSVHRAWNGGSSADAQFQSTAGLTIPMTSKASKDNQTYQSIIVGTSPFDPIPILKSVSIKAVVVPVVVRWGSTRSILPRRMRATAAPRLTRLQLSPVAQIAPLFTINGLTFSKTQFLTAFRRAEFWSVINGSSAYQNKIDFSYAAPYAISPPAGLTVAGAGCGKLGVVSNF